MDWKILSDTTRTLTEKSKPLIEKAKTYGTSAIAFAWKQAGQTPIFIKTEEEYNILMSEKRSICIAYDGSDPISQSIHIMMPIWATQAWTDTATLKYLDTRTYSDIARNLKINWPLEMKVSYMWQTQYILNDLDSIKTWWKKRSYQKDENKNSIEDNSDSFPTENTDTKIDPLKNI